MERLRENKFASQLGLVDSDIRKSPFSTSRRMNQDERFHYEFTQERKTNYLKTIILFTTLQLFYYFTIGTESAYFLRSEQNDQRF